MTKTPYLLLALLMTLFVGCETAPVVRPKGETRQPQILLRFPPVYPLELRKSGFVGNVVVEFIITSAGNVVNAKAIVADHPLFAQAAVEAVSQWKFRPGMHDGRVVNTRMQQTISFSLEEAAAASR